MPQDRKSYVNIIMPLAEKATKGSGIFPLTAIVLDIIETSSKGADGNYYAGTSKNAVNAKNHFGIKADSSWTGAVYVNPDVRTESNKFRKYPSIYASYADFVDFLQSNPRYRKAGVFNAKNANEQLRRIATAGYGGKDDKAYYKLSSKILSSVSKLYTGVKNEVNSNPFPYMLLGFTALFLGIQSKSND